MVIRLVEIRMDIAMGLSPFRNCLVYPGDLRVDAPNPNPANFSILELHEVGSAVVAKIKYPDCNTFEGVKICVFENTTAQQMGWRSSIDPHFSMDELSPIARFKPTSHGIKLAFRLAEILSDLTGAGVGMNRDRWTKGLSPQQLEVVRQDTIEHERKFPDQPQSHIYIDIQAELDHRAKIEKHND